MTLRGFIYLFEAAATGGYSTRRLRLHVSQRKFGSFVTTFQENFDPAHDSFGIKSSIGNSVGEGELELTLPNEFKAGFNLPPQRFIYQGWEFAGELGCEASGKYYPLDNLPADVSRQASLASQGAFHSLSLDDKFALASGGAGKLSAQGKLLTGGAAIAWGACVFFTDGLCALPAAAGSLGAFSVFNMGRVAVAAY